MTTATSANNSRLGYESASTNTSQSPVAAAAPVLRAREIWLTGSKTTVAPAARAFSAVRSVELLSHTMISLSQPSKEKAPAAALILRSARAMNFSSLNAGTMTEIFIRIFGNGCLLESQRPTRSQNLTRANEGGLREFREFARMAKFSRTGVGGILSDVIRENPRNSCKSVIPVHSCSFVVKLSFCRSAAPLPWFCPPMKFEFRRRRRVETKKPADDRGILFIAKLNDCPEDWLKDSSSYFIFCYGQPTQRFLQTGQTPELAAQAPDPPRRPAGPPVHSLFRCHQRVLSQEFHPAARQQGAQRRDHRGRRFPQPVFAGRPAPAQNQNHRRGTAVAGERSAPALQPVEHHRRQHQGGRSHARFARNSNRPERRRQQQSRPAAEERGEAG